MKKIYEIVFISIIFFIVCFIYKGQQRITLNEGKGWDGIYYYSITEQIQNGANPVVGEMPFIRRLGTPFLIVRFTEVTGINILDSALYVNLTGIFITVLLLFLWLKKFFKEFWICGLLSFLFMITWYAPVRFSFYVPLTSDSWGAVWFIAAMLVLDSIRKSYVQKQNRAFIAYILLYSIIVAVGNLFRESNAVLAILPFFIYNPFNDLKWSSKNMTGLDLPSFFKRIFQKYFVWQTLLLFTPVFFIVLSNIFINKHIAVSELNVYSYFENILTCLYTKTLPEYILGILIALGPFVLLTPFYTGQYKSIFSEKQELFALLIIALLFGYIGGTDTERILLMSGFPVLLIIIGESIRGIFYSSQRWWFYVLCVLQSIAFRFFWNLPDHTVKSGHTPVPFFGLMSIHVKYLYLYSHFSNYIINTILLAEYLFLFVITWYVMRNRVVLNNSSSGGRNSREGNDDVYEVRS